MTKEELIDKREKLGLSIAKLSEELGIKPSTFHRYTNGKLKIPLSIELALKTIERNRIESQESDLKETITLLIKSTDPDQVFFEALGKRLKEVRELRSMDRAYFAQINRMALAYLSNVENGKKSNMTLSTIRKFAKALHIRIEIIFDYREQ